MSCILMHNKMVEVCVETDEVKDGSMFNVLNYTIVDGDIGSGNNHADIANHLDAIVVDDVNKEVDEAE